MMLSTISPPSPRTDRTPRWDVVASPLGPLTLLHGARGLVGLRFAEHSIALAFPLDPARRDPDAVAPAAAQLAAYFAGQREPLDVELEFDGTDFQREVWAALRMIPRGTTITYAELADRVGRPHAVRAVGAAVGRTPVAIVIPCHRVVGSDGSLSGYVGGLARKRALLELEGAAGRGRPGDRAVLVPGRGRLSLLTAAGCGIGEP